MERLTKWNEQTEQAELLSWDEEEWKDFMGSLDVPIATELSFAINKLAEYEDAEEQGLLIRLPCKVGDDVWTIMCGMTGKHPALFRQKFTLSMFSHFGTAVFLTKEEAEAALAEMEG